MQSTRVRTRIIQHPFASLIQWAHLDSFYEIERDLFLYVQGLQIVTSALFEQDGRLIERDWSPAPPMPHRLVPCPKHLYMQYGGDPITISVNGKTRHRKLFIGELHVQPKRRPHVDTVLNLGEESSRWVKGSRLHLNDRAINRGEGAGGMTTAEICEEARWVIERLEQNRSVLVHCVAGMNRSATVCCAVLMLLEGLRADAALERVRRHHPWARPDSHHWLALR